MFNQRVVIEPSEDDIKRRIERSVARTLARIEALKTEVNVLAEKRKQYPDLNYDRQISDLLGYIQELERGLKIPTVLPNPIQPEIVASTTETPRDAESLPATPLPAPRLEPSEAETPGPAATPAVLLRTRPTVGASRGRVPVATAYPARERITEGSELSSPPRPLFVEGGKGHAYREVYPEA